MSNKNELEEQTTTVANNLAYIEKINDNLDFDALEEQTTNIAGKLDVIEKRSGDLDALEKQLDRIMVKLLDRIIAKLGQVPKE